MIRSYKKLSQKYIRSYWKRTNLTLLGIVLAVALITTIGLFFNGAYYTQIESAKDQAGVSYHVDISHYDQVILDKVSHNPNVASYGTMSQGEIFQVGKDFVSYRYADSRALELLKPGLLQGNMPANSQEAAIESWILSSIQPDLKLGDTFSFKKKTYKLVGILANQEFTQEERKGTLLTMQDQFKVGEGNLLIELHSKSNIRQVANQFQNLAGEENTKVNETLIQALQPDKALMVVPAIAIGIVMISTIVVIYNAFQISITERLKQFGLLRSIGATQKQIRKIVLREATFFSIIAIPIGVFLSICSVVVFRWILTSLGQNMKIVIPIEGWIIGLCSFISLLTVYLASFWPAFLAGRISPLLAISSRQAIKKETIKRNKKTTVRNFFSVPLSMALKNSKRSPGRYSVTILSIIISSILFITFSSLMGIAFQSKQTEMSALRMDVAVESKTYSPMDMEPILQKLNQVSNITKIYKQYKKQAFYTEMPSDKQIKSLQGGSLYTEVNHKGKRMDMIHSSVKAYDDLSLQELKKSVISGHIDVNQLKRDKAVILVEQAAIRNTKTQKPYLGPLSKYKVGDSIRVQKPSQQEEDRDELTYDEKKMETVEIVAIVKADILDKERSESFTLISSEQGMTSLAKTPVKPIGLGVELKDQSKNLVTVTKMKEALSGEGLQSVKVVDNIDQNQKQEAYIVTIKVLVYGFIAVITLIGSVNILNTVTISVMMRRKELAALKSIGMSQRDMKKMVTYEGLVYGFFGGLQGIFFGCLLSYIIYIALANRVEMGWTIPYRDCIIVFVAALVISYLSILGPLRKISKDNLIDVIREE
ncbi:putative ABC transport system permease protein [Thermoactinomyces sp. DSM 45891]|uniref:ABC transporter permease n=1 Tax=Thermoactinomyces sp. DSM 45891 TaxID=1761907 RepID=UPI0009221B6B|nr:FtsX-like permease family protein [Thermoactinomyces sp. DSM 45891]SFX10835.1 putative ABC transport system permease protein [Thermoactinomyces sp. DSM 45891]